MDNVYAGGAIAIASSVVGAITTYLLRRQEQSWSRAISTITQLSEQVADYYNEEQVLMDRLSRAEGRNPVSLKIEIRNTVNEDRGRWMTANDARKMIQGWGQ